MRARHPVEALDDDQFTGRPLCEMPLLAPDLGFLSVVLSFGTPHPLALERQQNGEVSNDTRARSRDRSCMYLIYICPAA
jgi:hypothetical protein